MGFDVHNDLNTREIKHSDNACEVFFMISTIAKKLKEYDVETDIINVVTQQLHPALPPFLASCDSVLSDLLFKYHPPGVSSPENGPITCSFSNALLSA